MPVSTVSNKRIKWMEGRIEWLEERLHMYEDFNKHLISKLKKSTEEIQELKRTIYETKSLRSK
jgi:septal ring factor EnvC (AmiA/AmiB activator)